VLPVEVQHREYYSRLLLGVAAASKGCGFVIGRHANLRSNLRDYPAGVFFEKSLDAGKREWFHDNIRNRNGMILVGNDEEGLATEVAGSSYMLERYSAEILNLATMVFAWGSTEARVIAEHFPNTQAQIIATGNPRADIWKSHLCEMFRKKADCLARRFGPYILMPCSVSFDWHGCGSDKLNEQSHAKTLSKDGGEREFLSTTAMLKNSLESFERLALRIANAFPDHTVLYRPHPTSDLSSSSNFARNVPNVKVVLEGEVTPWILGSTAVVHSACTTGLEGFLMRKPVITYRSLKGDSYANFISNRVGLIAETEDDVLQALRAIIDGRYDHRQIWADGISTIEDRISSLRDHEFAYMRIVDQLLAITNWRPASFDLALCRKRTLQRRVKDLVRRHVLRRYVFDWRDHTYYRQKFPGLNRRQLQEDVRSLATSAQLPVPQHVVKLDDSVYAVYS